MTDKTQEELKTILELHGKWLRNMEGGKRADLSGADLSGADLSGADLMEADLSGAVLTCANLSGAVLRYANLSATDLSGANLRYANLSRADLERADLTDADLTRADLTCADLTGADLTCADLTCADLRGIKADFLAKLSLARDEVPYLYGYVIKGLIDGSCYEGDCCCFCGTVAKIRHEPYRNMTNGLIPNISSPTEKWFLGIRKGDTPQNNQLSAITAEWMREFMDQEQINYLEYETMTVKEH